MNNSAESVDGSHFIFDPKIDHHRSAYMYLYVFAYISASVLKQIKKVSKSVANWKGRSVCYFLCQEFAPKSERPKIYKKLQRIQRSTEQRGKEISLLINRTQRLRTIGKYIEEGLAEREIKRERIQKN